MGEPQWAHGKICYVILPSTDPDRAAAFYSAVFGWSTRRHDDGSLAFDDTVGGVSGMWDTNRKPVDGGYEVDIMVDDARATQDAIESHGGQMITRVHSLSEHEVYGQFRDPDGNVLGIYQHGEGSADE